MSASNAVGPTSVPFKSGAIADTLTQPPKVKLERDWEAFGRKIDAGEIPPQVGDDTALLLQSGDPAKVAEANAIYDSKMAPSSAVTK